MVFTICFSTRFTAYTICQVAEYVADLKGHRNHIWIHIVYEKTVHSGILNSALIWAWKNEVVEIECNRCSIGINKDIKNCAVCFSCCRYNMGQGGIHVCCSWSPRSGLCQTRPSEDSSHNSGQFGPVRPQVPGSMAEETWRMGE